MATPPESVTIRPAAPNGARVVAEVHVASWRWAYRGLLPEELLDDLSVDEREATWKPLLRDPRDRSAVLVAQGVQGGVVGFAGVGPPQAEGEPEGAGELHSIYLLPDAIGRGIGRELLERATDRLREFAYERAILWVLEQNERARRFYEKAGWEWDGARGEHRFDCGNRPIVRYIIEL